MSWTLARLAEICGGQVAGEALTPVGMLCTARRPAAGALGLALDDRAAESLRAAGAYPLAKEVAPGPGISHPDPKGALGALIAALLPGPAQVAEGVSPRAEVHPEAKIHPEAGVAPFAYVGAGAEVGFGARLHPFSYLGDRSVLGSRSTLLPHATVMAGCEVGADAVVGPGSVVGAQGFALHGEGAARHRLPHAGGVALGDRVWLGANNTVDAGLLDPTVLGPDTQTDGQAHVAHNVELGEQGTLAAQTGLAGSTRIGSRFVAGGQAGVGDHLEIADDTTLGGGSGIVGNIRQPGQVLLGFPARPRQATLRIWALLGRLHKLLGRDG